jgi:hypothetical protein
MGRLTQVRKRAEFQLLLNTLAGDLGRVTDRLTLYRKLRKARKGSFSKAFINAPAFWSAVQGSLHDAAIHGLARAYDQREQRDVLTLKTVLDTIYSAPRFLMDGVTLDHNQLRADLRAVSHRTNPSVKHLMLWRNNLFAHRSADKILSGRVLSTDYPLTWKEIEGLLETGFDIVNRYSDLFFATVTSRNVVGRDDYLSLLSLLQAD